MPKRIRKHVVRRIAIRLPDLDHANTSVLNSLSSPRWRRNYKFAMEQFIDWYCSEPRLALTGQSFSASACTSNRSDWLQARSIRGSPRSGGRPTRRQIRVCESGTCCGHQAS